jgi:PAS domain S-box-containing protein
MKFSLKTKFYVYILPLLAVLPIVLYSLITPYTQLRSGFDQFEVDANRAQEAQAFAEALNTEQLELFHLLGAAPNGSYDISTNANYSDFEHASQSAKNQFQTIQSEVTLTLDVNDEERVAVDNIARYYSQFQTLITQVLSLSSGGKGDEAVALLGDKVDGLNDEYLRPEVEKLELIKEDDVKTSLPDLTNTLTHHGVIPVPGLQAQIEHVITHFENSVDTQKIGQLLDDMQSEVFYEVTQEKNSPVVAVQEGDPQIQEVEDQISLIITQLQQGLSPTGDTAQLALIGRVNDSYKHLIVLNDQAVTLGEQGKDTEALDMLRGSVDTYAEGTLDPLTKQLIANDKQDVATLVSTLRTRLDVITDWLYAIGALIFLLGLGSLWKLSKDIITPIIALRNAVFKLATGDFNTQVPVTSKDEIGDLAVTFNNMARKLQEFYSNLEEKVKAQTVELSNQVKELELTKKATINLLEDLNQEKTKIQESQAKDEAILGSIGDGLITTDKEGNVMLVNTAFERLLGWSMRDIVGKPLAEVIPLLDDNQKKVSTSDRPVTQVLHGRAVPTVITAASAYYQKKDGTLLPVVITVSPIITDGNLLGAVEVFRDITKERQIDKAKSEFVSLASHQLRTPLTAINWYAELLLTGEAGKLNKDQKEFLDQIHESNTRMVDLVNSLLNVSRIDMGTLASDPELTDIAKLSDSVLGELAPQITTHHILLEKKYPKDPLVVNVDPKLMRIVIQNLLSNAVKYTPEKGTVIVDISTDKKTMTYKVTDTGYGIPQAQQSKIFTKLFRADNAREKDPDGNGLGLYIVKSVVETHGGKVWFESVENKGTTFFVTLPLSGMKKIEGSKTLG